MAAAGMGHRHKKTFLRAGVRSAMFISGVLVFVLQSFLFSSTSSEPEDTHYFHRRLQENATEISGGVGDDGVDDACDDLRKADPAWFCVIYLVGILYMFLAIAIVCDELFVPALEVMASEHYMNLSMDVAGATLMAAGGSAPELFTSIFGTFVQESEVGIGTVVGSAVFNVMFVIAMCALCSREVLALTWWPLFRDSTYYGISLLVLALFVGVISPSEIELWEAGVLFAMYIGYVIMMAYNHKIYSMITGRELGVDEPEDQANAGESSNTAPETADAEGEEGEDETPAAETSAPKKDASPPPKHGSKRAGLDRGPSVRSLVSALTTTADGNPYNYHQWPGTFRSGILKLLRETDSWTNSAGIGIVAIISGDTHQVFRKVDVDDNGEIDKDELAQLFARLGFHQVTPEELDAIMEELDADKDGRITEEDFAAWYIQSEDQITSRVRVVFDHFDTDHSGSINRDKIQKLLETVEPSVTEKDIDTAMSALYQQGSPDEITFEEFSEWYIQSLLYQRQVKRAIEESNEDGIWEGLSPPSGDDGGCFAWIKYILVLPIIVVLGFTVPDVRRRGMPKYCYLSFLLSILWIGFFSYFMVDWAEVIGHTLGIPSVIMGLTLLAAGTSVPDLLSSVIVARMGEGDMAVSSSIGSNIFDILVGLPLPWILYTAINSTSITIGSENVWVQICTLLGMLIFVMVAVHCQGWKLTRNLAIMMLVFYLGFLALAISLELPLEVC